MKPPTGHRAFCTNELLIVIAVVAIWLAVSIPIYRQAIQSLSRHAESVGPIQQLQALGIALVGGPLMLALLCAVCGSICWVGEQIWKRLKPNR